jgi:hypothetical protein
MKKTFDVRVLLTVTTGRLLTKSRANSNGIEDLYEILGHMTGDSPFTHQLGRFSEECKPWLLRWFPELASPEMRTAEQELADAIVSIASNRLGDSVIEPWLAGIIEGGLAKSEYEVGQIPQDDHERKHPYDELVAMRGTDEGIIPIVTK